MEQIKPGDIVGYEGEGKLEYFTVDRIENGKPVCIPLSGDFYDEYDEIKLQPSKVKHFPSVTVTEEDLRPFLRYEKSFEEAFGDVFPYERIRCEKKIVMTGGDLLTALRRYKEKGYETAEKEWAEPVRTLWGSTFVFFTDPYGTKSVDGYRHLPQPGILFFNIFAEAVWISRRDTDEPEIDKLIARTEKTVKMLTLPVPERDYDDADKEAYINAFDCDEMMAAATDDEIALFVRYVDGLSEKGNKRALYAKAYSLYGGNRAYNCDWAASRDLLLKLMETEDDPFLANTLGYIFYYGRCTDGEPEYDRAFYYYSIGAAGGVYESRYKLSDMFRHGYGVKKNEKIAASIIFELYSENRKHILEGRTDCKFADVALRMGNLYRDGVGCEPDPDLAYGHYLEADFAIKERMRDCDYYGDASVAAGIGQAIGEILPETVYKKPRRSVYYGSLEWLLKSAFDLHRRVEAKIKKQKDGQYVFRFRILPKKGEEYPPKFFVTEPEAHFAGYLDRITAKTKFLYRLKINGKKFDGDSATVVFDAADYFGFRLYGERVAEISAYFKVTFPRTSGGKTYRFVSVTFTGGGKRYDYLCDIPDIKVGDEVAVPSPGGEARVTVAAVFEKSESETTLQISKYKSVLRKI